MAFFKKLASEAEIVILGGNVKNKYPKGFEYMANGHVYKVIEVEPGGNEGWRRLRVDDGSTEDVMTTTIDTDLETAPPYAPPGSKVGSMRAWEGGQFSAFIINDPSAPKPEVEAEAEDEEVLVVRKTPAKKKPAPKKKVAAKTKPKSKARKPRK